MHGYFDLNHLSWAGSELVVNQMVSHKLRLDAQAAHLLRMASMGIVTKDCSLVYQSTSFHSYWLYYGVFMCRVDGLDAMAPAGMELIL